MKHSLLFFLLWLLTPTVCAQIKVVEIEGVSINIELVQPQMANNENRPKARLLWLPSEYGVLAQEKTVARQLAKHGIESWFVDFYEAMFLSPTPSAVDKINPDWTAHIIALAAQNGDHSNESVPLWIIAPNKAAQTAVRGLQPILSRSINQVGLILINPNVYLETPLPGLVAHYWPETANINIPTTIIQAELSPWKLRVTELAEQLAGAGSDVFTQLIPKVRDRFYFRPDALAIEQEKRSRLAAQLLQTMRLQIPYLGIERTIKPLAKKTVKPIKSSRNIHLSDYQGKQNLSLSLTDIEQKPFNIVNYQGRVVLVNFWASWCPPCVHEMPSMARLKNHYSNQDFEILAVNLGEESAEIKSFLKEHPVNFPVLLDPESKAVKEWQVFAYPSSYVIDKKGQIRFALFGATEWDSTEHIQVIDSLLQEIYQVP